MLSGEFGQAKDRIFVNTHEPSRLTNATALLQVTQNRDGLVVGKSCGEQRGALAFREAFLAGAACQNPQLVAAIAKADTQVLEAALAIVSAVQVEAAESSEVVHGHGPSRKSRDPLDK
jgi:hypothetical protein